MDVLQIKLMRDMCTAIVITDFIACHKHLARTGFWLPDFHSVLLFKSVTALF